MIRLISECAGDDEIDIFPYIKHCALDTIVETAMGIELNAQLDSNQPYVKAVKEFSRLFLIYWRNPHYGMFGGLLWWILGYKSQTDEALDVLKETTNKVGCFSDCIRSKRQVVRERMEIFNDYRQNGVERTEKKKLNFLDLMLEYNAENQITIEQLREEVDTFTFAGEYQEKPLFNRYRIRYNNKRYFLDNVRTCFNEYNQSFQMVPGNSS